jgi:hypothetical protein
MAVMPHDSFSIENQQDTGTFMLCSGSLSSTNFSKHSKSTTWLVRVDRLKSKHRNVDEIIAEIDRESQ